jgi:hypothetical protein
MVLRTHHNHTYAWHTDLEGSQQVVSRRSEVAVARRRVALESGQRAKSQAFAGKLACAGGGRRTCKYIRRHTRDRACVYAEHSIHR